MHENNENSIFNKLNNENSVSEDNNNNNNNKSEPISTIREDKNTDKVFLSVKLTEKNKNPKTYYCKNCNTFPELKIKNNNSLFFLCEFEKNLEIDFKTLNKYIITQKESEEDLKKKLVCQNHLKVFKCYCCECKKNLCEDCYKEELQNYEHNILNQNNIYKHFDKMDEEIKYKEDFIDKYFTAKYKNKNKKQQNYFESNQNQSENKTEKKNNIDENSDKNTFTIKEETEEKNKDIDNSLDLFELYYIIHENKKKFPNYSHYLNIENIYYYLTDKLEIEYYSYMDQSEKTIRIFGKNFVENNKNNCYLIIKNTKVDLCEEYKIEKDERLKITLVKDKPIKDMSHMFYNCDYLSCITDKSKWNTDNVSDMNSMFYGCIALDYLPKNISE